MRHRRKLSMWGALPGYLGGKRRLVGVIFRELDRVLPRSHWAGLRFLDGFLGGGAVSLYAKALGFRVVATDIAERAVVVGQALIANQRTTLTKDDILRILSYRLAEPGRIESEMVPRVFTPNVAGFIDRALAVAAEQSTQAKAALLKLLAIKVAMLAHPMSQVRPGTVHRLATGELESITESCVKTYVDAATLTHPDRLWSVAQAINAGVFQGEGRVKKGDVLELLPGIEADVAYFDPPYPGTTAYEREYKVIDEILEGHALPVSPFSAAGGGQLIDRLLDTARHVPVVILSCGNAALNLTDLEAKMVRVGRQVHSIERRYAHKPSVARKSTREANREFIVVGVDPSARLDGLRLPTAAREEVAS